MKFMFLWNLIVDRSLAGHYVELILHSHTDLIVSHILAFSTPKRHWPSVTC
jgi:hypothetical protein